MAPGSEASTSSLRYGMAFIVVFIFIFIFISNSVDPNKLKIQSLDVEHVT
jgi:hypothetical protein